MTDTVTLIRFFQQNSGLDTCWPAPFGVRINGTMVGDIARFRCESVHLEIPHAIANTAGLCIEGGYGVASAISSRIEVDEVNNMSTNMLFSTLYCELHRLAKRELARQWFPASLSVTTLLHEAYLSISACERALFLDRGRFMGYAARVMRGLIIDDVRSRNAIKRGGEFQLTPLETDHGQLFTHPRELSAISDSLDQLAKTEPDLAEVVDLKFFCGLSFAEIGALQNISERTAQRQWEKARLYLRCSLRAGMPLREVDVHA